MKLSGIRVVDLSLFLPGPTVTQMMADHGAEVIKVESVEGGEPNRQIGQRRAGETVYFACTHRGKKSLALNLKAPEGLAVFNDLAATADVVVESFRPGVVARLGVGYDAVRRLRPDVVYASISAFGQSGPLVANPAHDLAVEAMCGVLSVNADASGNPCMPAIPAGDMLAATLTLSGIMMALYRRSQTGQGDYLDVSMMDAILSCMPNSMGAVFGEQRAPTLNAERIWGGGAMYRIYQTADGRHIVLGGSEIKFARNLLTQLGRPDLIEVCERPPGEQQAAIDYFTGLFLQRTQAQWVTFFEHLDVCFGPVNDLRTGMSLPQTRHREMCLVDAEGREHLGIPVKFRAEPGRVEFAAPGLGEHTRQVLLELGRGAEEVEALMARGVVFGGPPQATG